MPPIFKSKLLLKITGTVQIHIQNAQQQDDQGADVRENGGFEPVIFSFFQF